MPTRTRYLASVPLWWFLILYEDHLLGVMEVLLQRRLYLECATFKCSRIWRKELLLRAELAKINTGHELLGARAAADILPERSKGHFADKPVADKGIADERNFALYALAVIACVLIGLYSTWNLFDRNSGKGQVTLISIMPVVSSRNSHTHVAERTLLYSVDPPTPWTLCASMFKGTLCCTFGSAKTDSSIVRGPFVASPF